MHEDELEHEHYSADSTEQALSSGDLIQLVTVGIDVGSSTSHLMFSRLHLERQGKFLSSRYVVVLREVLHRSPILLTPYAADYTIDSGKLAAFVQAAYQEAGLEADDVDSGAIILTGEAVKRDNARVIAETLAGESGRFVCATAGHNLEAVLAAHGSGAVALSRREHQTILNVDVGGGTTKLALIDDGEIVQTAAVNVGGRLVAINPDGLVARIEPAARQIAPELKLGARLGAGQPEHLAGKLAGVLFEVLQRRELSPLATSLMLTPALSGGRAIDAVTFSGGVSEYLFGQEQRTFGDLAQPLAEAIRARFHELPAVPRQAGERIRATVIGASQFTVQVSGNTIAISRPELLPLHNLQVIYPRLPRREDVSTPEIAQAIASAYTRLDLIAGERPVALALDWDGTPTYALLRTLAEGIALGLGSSLAAGHPLVLVFSNDCGNLIGAILRDDLEISNDIISIDGIELNEFDFIDIGEILRPALAVPVVVKSLVFPAVEGPRGELLA